MSQHPASGEIRLYPVASSVQSAEWLPATPQESDDAPVVLNCLGRFEHLVKMLAHLARRELRAGAPQSIRSPGGCPRLTFELLNIPFGSSPPAGARGAVGQRT